MEDVETGSSKQSSSSTAFGLLDPRVQRQLYAMKWPSLRPIQVDAITAYLKTDKHLMLMAETAAGKTEAAFLPVLSSIANEPAGSVRALYIGPLKALINDQFGRVETLCTHMEMPVHRWHGDVDGGKKELLTKHPGGVLLITPESIESLLVNRTAHLPSLFGGLRAIVIDELHAFLQGVRGLHLASLLARIGRYRAPDEPPTRMIGLSATIGDRGIGQRYLSPKNPETVEVITDEGGESEVMMRVHGYDVLRLKDANEERKEASLEPDEILTVAMAEDLVEHCRSHSNLVFANAKGDIELLADAANEACRRAGLPESILVHHGSLSKEVREDTEERMKSRRPHTAICSSTLEMGIDIGSVRLVGQIGAPWSVASMKQRMGRSGRKAGEARRLRCYVDCTTDAESDNPFSALPLELLQTIAVCDLLLEGWVEPPAGDELDLSTLSHQIMSTIAERGAATAHELQTWLCREGPFGVSQEVFVRLLRALGGADIIEQGIDGKLILGMVGEKLRTRRDFYAAFASRTEYAVIAGARVLGSLPIDALPKPGDHIVFAARRWQVVSIDAGRRELYVEPARRRKKPVFLSAGGMVHHRVVDRMMSILAGSADVPYLDVVAREALARARAHAATHRLAERRSFPIGEKRAVWATWTGTAETMTYEALMSSVGVQSRRGLAGLICECPIADLESIIDHWSVRTPDLVVLAEHVQPKQRRKYDVYLPTDLLEESIASAMVWRPPVG